MIISINFESKSSEDNKFSRTSEWHEQKQARSDVEEYSSRSSSHSLKKLIKLDMSIVLRKDVILWKSQQILANIWEKALNTTIKKELANIF